MNFADRLVAQIRQCRNPVCVGLDPRVDRLPASIVGSSDQRDPAQMAQAFQLFCHEVIAAVAGLVPVVKPQAAFFEQLGPAGMQSLAAVIDEAHQHNLLVVLDGKRNDIGSTATAYAEGYLGAKPASNWGADALTVSPYLGDDSLTPFVDVAQQRGAGLFVLVKTSNPGGQLFQNLRLEKGFVYHRVAEHVETLADQSTGAEGYGAVGAVVGATYPEELASLRQSMPHTLFLIPGFGAQGGSAADVAGGFDAQGLGAIVNSSRGIIFAHQLPAYEGLPWQDAVRAATEEMILQLRTDTPVGKL